MHLRDIFEQLGERKEAIRYGGAIFYDYALASRTSFNCALNYYYAAILICVPFERQPLEKGPIRADVSLDISQPLTFANPGCVK